MQAVPKEGTALFVVVNVMVGDDLRILLNCIVFHFTLMLYSIIELLDYKCDFMGGFLILSYRFVAGYEHA